MRHEQIVTIPVNGRDSGKHFHLLEMCAYDGEKWAMQIMLALARSGVSIPEEIVDSGMSGMARYYMHLISGVAFPEIEPLFDQMWSCVTIIPDITKLSPDPMNPMNGNVPHRRALNIRVDIEEVDTLVLLRAEVLRLHLRNFTTERILMLTAVLRTIGAGPNTGTSPAQ